MPGRAVGVGAGVSPGGVSLGAAAGASLGVAGGGVSLAGGRVGESVGAMGLGARVAVAVGPSTATDESWLAVPVGNSKGSVHVGTGVRARVVVGGLGAGLQAESMKMAAKSHKTAGYRRIGRYSIPINRGA